MSKIEFYFDASLKDYCTFHIGGRAKYLFVVYDTLDLYQVCMFCSKHKILYKVIGLGANLLFNDIGYDGAIIVNKSENIECNNQTLTVNSGTTIASIIEYTINHSLSGFEHFAGIPATIGGAIVNNLGSNEEIGSLVESVKCFEADNPKFVSELGKKECNFGYRDSIFKSNKYIIMSVELKLKKGNKEEIRERTLENLRKKLSTQPMDKPSAGSIFKRSTLIPARIIDELGLKGTQIGGAMISTKHAGFIINDNNATSEDVKKLINLVNDIIKQKYNTTFTPEIEFVENKN